MLRFNFHRLTLATVAAAMVGVGSLATPPPAQAVNLADDNQGEVALFQYYTVRNGWQTFLRIINTSADTVAVKLRFRESYNSREVLDFTLVLSPFDMWNGWTDANAGGPGVPGLITDDNSCTVPGVGSGGFIERIVPLPDGRDYPTKYVAFKNISYQNDGGPTGIDRALEGYAEVISLGRINDPNASIAVSALHKQPEGVPDCAVVETLLNHQNPGNLAVAAAQFIEPRNVLKANGYLFKGTRGQGAGFDPVMLANFFNPEEDPTGPPPQDTWLGVCFNNVVGDCELTANAGPGYDDLIEELSPTHPNASRGGATPDLSHAFPPVSKIRIDDQQFIGFGNASFGAASPVQVTDEWDRGIDAVSAVLTRTALNNEWAARDTPGFAVESIQTESVITFPTKHYYVDRDSGDPFATLGDGDAIAPFSEVFQPDGMSCDDVRIDVYNREEGVRTDFSPFEITRDEFCREVNILAFISGTLTPNLTDNPEDVIGVARLPDPTLPDPIESPLTGEPDQYEGWFHLEFTGANALAGLGSDPEANQIYDNPAPANLPPVIRFGASYGEIDLDPPIKPFSDPALVALNIGWTPDPTAAGRCTPPLPAPFTFANPPQPMFTDADVLQIDPTPPGVNLTLPATLFSIGTYSRPFLAGTPSANVVTPADITVVQAGVCDDPSTPDLNEAQNWIIEVPTELLISEVDHYPVTYTGLPVIGFNFTLLNAGSAERNYASITDHGYEREVMVEAICNARFQHSTLRWILNGGPNPFNPFSGLGTPPLCP